MYYLRRLLGNNRLRMSFIIGILRRLIKNNRFRMSFIVGILRRLLKITVLEYILFKTVNKK